MKIPYSGLELRVALIGAMHAVTDKKSMRALEKLVKELGLPVEKEDLNKKIARFNGISVAELINSPNYSLLRDEYLDNSMAGIIDKMVVKFHITQKEAYALVALGSGLLHV